MNAKVLLAGLEPLDITATDVESLLQLYNLLFYTSPYVIVEAGTYKGHFSVAAARLLPKCHVFTADIDRFCELPDLPNLTFYHGDFADMMEEFNITHDFAFIDSGPATVEGFKNPNHVRLKHWKVAQQRANVMGLVVSHDMQRCDWPGAVEIARDSLLLNGYRGLALWQKKIKF